MPSDIFKGKKIAIDARFLATHHGGLARYSRELIKSLVSQETGVSWVVIARDDEEFPEDLKQAIENAKDHVEVVGTSIVHYTTQEQTEFLGLLNEIGADLVHFTNFNHPVRYKKPFVVTVHDLTLGQFSPETSWLKKKLYDYVIKRACEKSKLVLTVSEFSKKAIARAYNITPSKIAVTYNGIDHKRFVPISNMRHLKQIAKHYKIDGQFVLYVGQWADHKNLPRLLEAFKKVNNEVEHKDKYQLVIVGKPRQYYEGLKNKVKELGLQKRIVLPGFVEDDDLPSLYNAARLFAFPSLMEGFGIPPLEAMACGIPVISSDATSLPEVLGKAARYFNPENVEDITKALIDGLTNAKLREELVAKGLKQANQYNWDKTAQDTLEGYAKVLRALPAK